MKKDQVLPINYCTHAIKDLPDTAEMSKHMASQSAHLLYRLIAMLQPSVKFILSNCCNLVEPDEVRQTYIDLVHHPFPCVDFETPWMKDEVGPDTLVSSSKRFSRSALPCAGMPLRELRRIKVR